MGTLIRRVSGTAGIGYGVNLLEMLPPGSIRAGGSAVLGVIGDFPWGPANTITEISSPGELFATFCPPAFDAAEDYTAMRAFLNKTFPAGMKVLRIAATSAVVATKTFDDASEGDSVVATAKYAGAIGNSINVAWTANADTAANRDATVTIGTGYSAFYPNVVTIPGSVLTVTDPGDPYVTFSKAGSATLVPLAIAATALASGADGTAVAGDYVGTASSIVGMRKFYVESVVCDVLFVAEAPSALLDAVNAGLKAYVNDTKKGMAVYSTVNGQAVTAAKTYVTTYATDRGVYPYPRVLTTNGYAADQDEIEVCGSAFMAALIVNTDPWLSPGGANGAQFLTGVTGLENEDITAGEYDALNAKGVAPFQMVTALGGAIARKAVTTSLTSGLTKIRRRRMTDYLLAAIAERGQFFAEKPLDLDFATQTLGPETGAYIGEIGAFLADEKAKNHIASYLVSAFSSATLADIEAGRWTISIRVRLFADMDELVLAYTVGDSVVTAAA